MAVCKSRNLKLCSMALGAVIGVVGTMLLGQSSILVSAEKSDPLQQLLPLLQNMMGSFQREMGKVPTDEGALKGEAGSELPADGMGENPLHSMFEMMSKLFPVGEDGGAKLMSNIMNFANSSKGEGVNNSKETGVDVSEGGEANHSNPGQAYEKMIAQFMALMTNTGGSKGDFKAGLMSTLTRLFPNMNLGKIKSFVEQDGSKFKDLLSRMKKGKEREANNNNAGGESNILAELLSSFFDGNERHEL